MASVWSKKLWSDRSREYLQRTIMQQKEYDTFLMKRCWLENKLKGFRLSSLLDVSAVDGTSNSGMRLAERIDKIHPRLLMYGSSVAGTAFERGDADFAVVFPIGDPLLGSDAPPHQAELTPESVQNLKTIPVSSVGCVGGMLTIPRLAQPAALTALYHHIMIHESSGGSTPSDDSNTAAASSPQLQRIFRARIPIMQYVPTLAELQQRNKMQSSTTEALSTPHVTTNPTSKREHYDISLSVDGSRNSLLIRSYMQTYPQLRVVCLVLKQWGRYRKILNARRGWISPYALTIMIIHYMVEAGHIRELIPPETSDVVLKSVAEQMMQTTSSDSADDGKYHVSEFDTLLPLVLGAADEGETPAICDVAEIVRGFFAYYGGVDEKFDFDTHVVDIRRIGRVTEKEQWFSEDDKKSLSDEEKWHRVGYGVLMIRDPYENHSLGRSVEFFRGESIREEMRVAAMEGVSLDLCLPRQ